MKPFSRVVALDNNQEDLDAIVRALGRAGYSSIPYLFDVGEFVPPITQPCAGLRLVFSDIHLTPTSSINGVDHAATIGNFLKQIVPTGPYGVIFWSKHEADERKIVSELISRAPDIGFNLPVFFGFMDKNKVGIGDPEAEVDYELLGKLIYEEVSKSQSLSIIMNWEERILLAATQASNSLFQIVKNTPEFEGNSISEEWLKLLAFLSQEAVGKTAAISNASGALDNALLPVLEDQLRIQPSNAYETDNPICESLSSMGNAKLKLSASIDRASLNSFYLVEDFEAGGGQPYNFRGVISKLNDDPRNFISDQFGADWREILYKEFIINGESINIDDKLVSRAAPCLISLSAECDEIQGKIPSHRYLLGVIFDETDLKFFLRGGGQPTRAALQNIGKIKIGGETKCILVSCRRFTSEHSVRFSFPVIPIARLRRNTLEEIIHHYTTHARRPGVMRFY